MVISAYLVIISQLTLSIELTKILMWPYKEKDGVSKVSTNGGKDKRELSPILSLLCLNGKLRDHI